MDVRKFKAPVLAALLAAGSPAYAALVEITVQGTWEATNTSPVVNPMGLVNGDTFLMHAFYDDTSLFNGPEGVTAILDPSVNPGTSFGVTIPHAGVAPNPLVFTHDDHTSIGFSNYAEIEFTGTDALIDPGVFRNFEIHVDFSWGGEQFDLDLFMGAIQPESDLFNESQDYNLAAVGDGSGHLEVIPNAPEVPIPAAAWLFGSALLTLLGVKRKKA